MKTEQGLSSAAGSPPDATPRAQRHLLASRALLQAFLTRGRKRASPVWPVCQNLHCLHKEVEVAHFQHTTLWKQMPRRQHFECAVCGRKSPFASTWQLPENQCFTSPRGSHGGEKYNP
ncbi:MAG: hypothetical protein Q4D66_05775 [Bacteroidales bacterium]|nr:hypothetical protein [Bacteroidales bacterium]